jgi:hypothetical protein
MTIRPHRAGLAAAVTVVCISTSVFAQQEGVFAQQEGRLAPRPAPRPASPANSSSAMTRCTIDPEAVSVDVDEFGTLWARGSAYKASFDARGVTYIPYLGAHAPRDFALGLTVETVRIAGAEVAFARAAAPAHGNRAVSFEREAFVERYDLSGRAIEQSFVFPTLERRGELALRMTYSGEYTARGADRGLRFENDLGAIVYGQALAIDRLGRRIACATTVGAGAIEIVVPADFVEQAALPLVVDPLITTFAVDASAGDDTAADVAYDASLNQFLVCFQHKFSATDNDVYCQLHDTSGALVAGSGVWTDSTTVSWSAPRCANQNVDHKFLVVAEVGAAGARIVRGRVRNADNTQSAQFDISGPESGEKFAPDVGGDSYAIAPAYFCVAYERAFSATDHDVHAQMVQSNGTLLGPGTILVDNSGAYDSAPQISKGNQGRNWLIAWQRTITALDHDIYAARLQWNGLITQVTFPIAATASDDTNPCPSTPLNLEDRYMVVFERLVGAQHDIEATGVFGTTIVGTFNVAAVNGLSPLDERAPAVDCDGTHFNVAFTQDVGAPNLNVYACDMYTSGSANIGRSEGAVLLAGSTTAETAPRIASIASGGGSVTRSMIVWQDAGTLASASDIEGATYQGSPGGVRNGFCFGDGSFTPCPCGNSGSPGSGCANSVNASGALLTGTGASAAANDTFGLLGSGMPPNSTCLYFQGLNGVLAGGGQAFGDGLRCVEGSVIRLGTKLNNGFGNSTYPAAGDVVISIRGVIPAAGDLRRYQVWYRNAASFCTSSTFNLTNGLAVYWTP